MTKLWIGGSGRVDMGDVVNLRQFRKRRARQEKADKAAENRRKHGRGRNRKLKPRCASATEAKSVSTTNASTTIAELPAEVI